MLQRSIRLLLIAATLALLLIAVVSVIAFSVLRQRSVGGEGLSAEQQPGASEDERAASEAQQNGDRRLTILIAGSDEKLTDSMMLVRIDQEQDVARVLSIPRDLWYNRRKINEEYYHGGSAALLDAIAAVTGYEPDHYAIVDMAGFVEIVNHLDGIEITLDEDLYDPTLLTPERDAWLEYSAGTHRVSGEEALLIARSRATTDDFDRSRRQASILEGLQSRLEELGVGDLATLYRIGRTIFQYVDTDIGVTRAVNLFLTYGIVSDFEREGLSIDNVLYNDHGTYLPEDIAVPRTPGAGDDPDGVVRSAGRERNAQESAANLPYAGNKRARLRYLVERDLDDLDTARDAALDRYLESRLGTREERDEQLQSAGESGVDGPTEHRPAHDQPTVEDLESDEERERWDDRPVFQTSYKRRVITAAGLNRPAPSRGQWLLLPVERDWEHVAWFTERFFEDGSIDRDLLADRLNGLDHGEKLVPLQGSPDSPDGEMSDDEATGP